MNCCSEYRGRKNWYDQFPDCIHRKGQFPSMSVASIIYGKKCDLLHYCNHYRKSIAWFTDSREPQQLLDALPREDKEYRSYVRRIHLCLVRNLSNSLNINSKKTMVIKISAPVSRSHLPYIINTIIPENAQIPAANVRQATNNPKTTFQLSVVASSVGVSCMHKQIWFLLKNFVNREDCRYHKRTGTT